MSSGMKNVEKVNNPIKHTELRDIYNTRRHYMANIYFMSFTNAIKTYFTLTANFKVLLAVH